mgnify:CR=1 FL=1
MLIPEYHIETQKDECRVNIFIANFCSNQESIENFRLGYLTSIAGLPIEGVLIELVSEGC